MNSDRVLGIKFPVKIKFSTFKNVKEFKTTRVKLHLKLKRRQQNFCLENLRVG